jgi:hypothetical protein
MHGRDRVGFAEKALVKSRDKMKPRTPYDDDDVVPAETKFRRTRGPLPANVLLMCF